MDGRMDGWMDGWMDGCCNMVTAISDLKVSFSFIKFPCLKKNPKVNFQRQESQPNMLCN